MSDPHLETIHVDHRDGVATITLDRPARKNAVNALMWDELLTTFRALGGDADARVVVITGAGGEFCSGADLTPGQPGPTTWPACATWATCASRCTACPSRRSPGSTGSPPVPGSTSRSACDLIVASRRARFSEIFARRGLSIDFGGSWLLPRLVGLQKAKELALFADIIDAAEAERLGLVNRVVDVEDLDAVVGEWASRLAAGPPIALSLTKRMLNDSFDRTLEEAVEDEARVAGRELRERRHRRGRHRVLREAGTALPGTAEPPVVGVGLS